jgi:hypothetical protein
MDGVSEGTSDGKKHHKGKRHHKAETDGDNDND